MNISYELANSIYDILVREAGALEYDRTAFTLYMVKGGTREFRFQGHLGFGGKLRVTHKVYVDCYPEHLSPAREKIINKTNALIDALILENS